MNLFPTCFAHDFGRAVLDGISDPARKTLPSESQAQQMNNLATLEEMPLPLQRQMVANVTKTDTITRFMVARCAQIMPDATFEPRALLYARLLASTVDEAMVICAMLFAIQLDSEGAELTYNRLLELTRGQVLSSDDYALILKEQVYALEVEGLDHNRLNHKDSYKVEVKV